jgi:hypothetical protein
VLVAASQLQANDRVTKDGTPTARRSTWAACVSVSGRVALARNCKLQQVDEVQVFNRLGRAADVPLGVAEIALHVNVDLRGRTLRFGGLLTKI